MFDLKIDRLRLNIDNAAGHEHRIHAIALRAVALLAERLDGSSKLSRERWDTIAADPIDLHLNVMSDEQAAEGIAMAWANALTGETGTRQD
jgi:limonene-1,2-epoxide hydrolase